MKYRISVQVFVYAVFIIPTLIFAQDDLLTKNSRDCWLQVGKLCADQIKARHLCAKKAELPCLCSEKARLKDSWVERMRANEACIRELRALRAVVDNLVTNSVCAQRVSSDSVCTATVNAQYACIAGPIVNCSPLKGAAIVSPPYTYNLGDPIIFQTTDPTIDPNGDILQTGTAAEGTVYRVPRTGWYAYELQITSSQLQGPSVIAGQPIAQPFLYVNDVVRRNAQSTYLSFANIQTSRVSGITRLIKGDHVHAKFFVNVIDPVLGEVHYPGTVTLLPNDIVNGIGTGTFMIFHYLSDDSCADLCPCLPQPCTPVTVECPTVSVDCKPCNLDCLDCDPCGTLNP